MGFAISGMVFLTGCQQIGPIPSEPTSVSSTPSRDSLGGAELVTATPIGSSTTLPAPELFEISWQDLSPFRSGLTKEAQAILEVPSGMSIYHLDLVISDDLKHVSGREQVLYTNSEDVPLDRVIFRLYPNLLGGKLSIDDLKVDQQKAEPRYGLEQSLMEVPLAKPLLPGEKVVLSIVFGVEVPSDQAMNFGVLAYSQGILAYDHGYPIIAIFNDGSWNSEIPPSWGDLGSSDAAYYLVRITAPESLRLAVSGNQIDREVQEGTQIDTYAIGPARDFYLAASTDFTTTERKIGETTIRAFAPSAYSERVESAINITAHALQVYSSHYIGYPYTEIELVVTPTSALGMEYPGIIALNRKLFTVEQDLPVSPEDAWLESTVAHEVAHQWFYNMIGNDQLNEPWLDESLAQFATLEYFRSIRGHLAAEEFQQTLDGRWSRIDRKPIPIDQPVSAFDPVSYSAIVYGRGAIFLETLEKEIGQQAFDDFMIDYLNQELWGISTTGIFQSLAEKHCSCDLDQLFERWIYPQGSN